MMSTAKLKYRRYPWTDWFALGEFSLVRGEHFGCRTDSMAQIIRAKATALGLHVSVRIADAGDRLEVVVKKEQPDGAN